MGKNDTINAAVNETELLKTKLRETEEQLKEAVAAKEKIEAQLRATEISTTPKNFKGFIITTEDPYVDGVKRFIENKYNVSKISGNLNVEYASDKAEDALKNYILRAAGAGDKERVKWAENELKKVKKG